MKKFSYEEKLRIIEDTFGYNSPEAIYIRGLYNKKNKRKNFSAWMRVFYINKAGDLHVELYKWALEEFIREEHVEGDMITLYTRTHVITGEFKSLLKSGVMLTKWKIEER